MRKFTYIPALRFRALTPAYDGLVRWTSAEAKFRSAMTRALNGRRFSSLVDLGCGTGTAMAGFVRAFPHARITGLDADAAALGIAAGKLGSSAPRVLLLHGNAGFLPFADGSIDVFTSSLFFHHLDDSGKRLVFREVRRCLVPGGTFVVADWDRAASPLRRLAFNLVRTLDGFGVTRAHARGELGHMLASSGFGIIEKLPVPAVLGQITVWTCTSPGHAHAGSR